MRIAGIVFLTLGLGICEAQKGRVPAVRIAIPAFPDGGGIPAKYGCTNRIANISPAIQWSGSPDETMSFALILHDSDAPSDFLHWAIFNIPVTATGLPEGVPAKAALDDGSAQIKNSDGSLGYFSPCPPSPATHRYQFEVYALDTKLDPVPKNRDKLMSAMKGHIVAKGTYIGVFRQ